MNQTLFDLKTPSDVLCFLCRLESRMLDLRAFHRRVTADEAGISDPASEAFRDMQSVVDAFVAVCTDVGHLTGFIDAGEVPPLSANGQAVLSAVAAVGKDIFPHNGDTVVRSAASDVALAKWEHDQGFPGYENTFSHAGRAAGF